ncbi:hypothetical protein G6F68_019201 [Rhizopus microsporus]|nr:hypothetical protein G6F68_019201 [Rhizopus microsporus]
MSNSPSKWIAGKTNRYMHSSGPPHLGHYHRITGQHWIIGKDRLEALQEELDQCLTVLDTVKGSALVGSSYQHPISREQYPVLAGKHVTAESGTALVHTAPGHGLEDYEVCLANNIQPFSWGK